MHDDEPTQQADATLASPSIESGESSPILPAKQFGTFRLTRRIGKGGMGEVWLARHELLAREVAVKFLSTAVMDRRDPAFAEFIEGAKAAASLGHMGLNKVYHADVADGVPYLVLEYLDGPNLHELIARSGLLDLPTARFVIEAVGEAIAELHRHDLVHRDLKPSNIMLTSEGRIVVTDFGLACARPASALRGNSGIVCGTPTYMAPEMFDGVVSARTDVYAIGMMAYELLCGKTAFAGTFEELENQHRQVEISVEPLRAAGVPDAVIDVILRATSKDILFRPKTARHVLGAFRAAFDSAKIQPASREALTRMLARRAAEPSVDQSEPAAAPAGTMAETLSQLADRKRELRNSEQLRGTMPNESMDDTCDEKGRRADRRRIWIAGVIACLVGSLAIAEVMNFNRVAVRWEHFVEVDLAHQRVVGFTSTGAPMTTAAPPWATFLVIVAPIVGFTIITVGVPLLLYRRLRGAPLPQDRENTVCGWCHHELRGISTPICSECGHRIGDQGPDAHGVLPLGRRWQRRLVFRLCLPGVFFVSVLAADIVLFLIVRLALGALGGVAIGGAFFIMIAVPGALAIMLAFYESFLKFDINHSGRAWCRACKGELRNLVEPICPTCGARI